MTNHQRPHGRRPSKSREMRLLEVQLGKPIDQIILDAASGTKYDYEIAHHLGLIPPTLSIWIARLGLREEIDELRRAERRAGVPA